MLTCSAVNGANAKRAMKKCLSLPVCICMHLGRERDRKTAFQLLPALHFPETLSYLFKIPLYLTCFGRFLGFVNSRI